MTMLPAAAVWGSMAGGTVTVSACHPIRQSQLITYNPPTVGRLVIVTGPFQFLAVSFVSAVLVAS